MLLLLLPSIRDGRPWGCSAALAQPLERLLVERIGGHDRAGLPGSRVESRGELELSKLAPAIRRAIEELFDNPEKVKPPPGAADFESYRITRDTAAGAKTILVPFNAVPEVVRKSVRDSLK
jgi:hypothetical protein